MEAEKLGARIKRERQKISYNFHNASIAELERQKITSVSILFQKISINIKFFSSIIDQPFEKLSTSALIWKMWKLEQTDKFVQ